MSRLQSTILSAVVLVGMAASLPSCGGSVLALRRQTQPASEAYELTATLHNHLRGYYSAVVSVRNNTSAPLSLTSKLFSLEAEPPTQFVPAERIAFGRAGFRLPPVVSPGDIVQGEIYFGIRGTARPSGPVTLVVKLPDGTHKLAFELL